MLMLMMQRDLGWKKWETDVMPLMGKRDREKERKQEDLVRA